MKFFLRFFSRPQNIFWEIFLSLLIFIGIRYFSYAHIIKAIFHIPSLSLWAKILLTKKYIFDSFILLSFPEKFVLILFPILLSLNILFFIRLFKKKKTLLRSKGFWGSFVGIFLGVFGVGCLSCGALVLAPVLSFLGLRFLFLPLQNHAFLISLFGLVLLVASNIYLIRQIEKPEVC